MPLKRKRICWDCLKNQCAEGWKRDWHQLQLKREYGETRPCEICQKADTILFPCSCNWKMCPAECGHIVQKHEFHAKRNRFECQHFDIVITAFCRCPGFTPEKKQEKNPGQEEEIMTIHQELIEEDRMLKAAGD